jgi:hypothetical protein
MNSELFKMSNKLMKPKDEIIVTQKIDIPHIEITDSDEDYCYFIYFD